ncbi:YqgE/AlgH family protein [Niabella yanshanensis]|uniref:YqgE/AlgH family protein n=1 Tax=Niabella yanshanensis TaxID=577386 RepID=A0ABZ0WD77_9BACT|nr:YqgE/AlgH family protein [Niabella yanshanensis]WQD40644.1 YqgE/AlgH family protein [Niabella yanshanensis]
MSNYQGKILSSTPSMDDPNFDSSVVFVAEHNEQGALGFVINKIFARSLNELVEFSSSPAFPLYEGGPVDQEHLYFVHRRNELIPGATPIIDDMYLGGDFKKTIEQINNKNLTSKDIKIFIGYCGWDTGDLEAEIAEGSWEVKEPDADGLFGH